MDKAAIPRKIKIPSHVAKFRCLQCGECCTSKWTINVDTVSYDILCKKFSEIGRLKELQNNILHEKGARQIQFLENGKCPYLACNNLCAIQLEIGQEYLFDICKVYPRKILVAGDTLEFSLFMTCKAAVNTLQAGPIRSIEAAWPIEGSPEASFSFMQPHSNKRYYPNKPIGDFRLPYRTLEERLIDMLQDRGYTVSERVVGLGHALSQTISGDTPQSDTEIEKFDIPEKRHTAAQPDWERRLGPFYQMSNIFTAKFPSLAASKHLRSILLALSSDQSPQIAAVNRIPNDYQEKLKRYYQPACSEVESILENYLVNYILRKHFYFKPLHYAYYRMAFNLAAITALSLGYCIKMDQVVSKHITLQAIYDVENIFYSGWFMPSVSFLQGGKNHRRIIENGIALVDLQ